MTSGHAALVTRQFGARAEAYVESTVHAQGADLDQAAALLDGQRTARVLDLGCGGGHVSFCAAPLVAEVTAYDLSADMLAAVARVAAEARLHQYRDEARPRRGAALPRRAFRCRAEPLQRASLAWLRPGACRGASRAAPGRPRLVHGCGFARCPACSTPICKASNSSAILRMCATIRSPNGPDALTAAGFALKNVTARRLRLDFAHLGRAHGDAAAAERHDPRPAGANVRGCRASISRSRPTAVSPSIRRRSKSRGMPECASSALPDGAARARRP